MSNFSPLEASYILKDRLHECKQRHIGDLGNLIFAPVSSERAPSKNDSDMHSAQHPPGFKMASHTFCTLRARWMSHTNKNSRMPLQRLFLEIKFSTPDSYLGSALQSLHLKLIIYIYIFLSLQGETVFLY